MHFFLITSKLNFETAGGSVADLHLKARGLVELGHQVTVVTAFSRINKINQKLPYTVIEENITSGRLLAIQRGVYWILKKYESTADAFYIDGHIFLYGGGLYRILGGQKPVTAFFNIRLNCWGDTQNNIAHPSIFRRLKRKLRYILEHQLGVPIANHLDNFIFNTPQVEKLYTSWGLKKNKSTVIEDFVDTTAITTVRRPPDELSRHQSAANPITFFTTGRMIREKGFDLVIRAIALIPNKTNLRVIMSGGGPEYERLVSLAKELGVAEYFQFPGWVNKEQLQQFFYNSHIFVFPKWWMEYGSAVLTEAMAFGLPLIVPVGGALEWLATGAALTFTPDTIEELAKQMQKLAESSEIRLDLARQSHEHAATLDCRRLAAKLEKYLNSTLAPAQNIDKALPS